MLVVAVGDMPSSQLIVPLVTMKDSSLTLDDMVTFTAGAYSVIVRFA